MNWRGQHTVKAGVQFEHIENSVLSGAQAETIDLFWNSDYVANSGQRFRGKYGHYNISRLYTAGDITADSLGLFVQDAWSVHNRLTLNLGCAHRARRHSLVSRRQSRHLLRIRTEDCAARRLRVGRQRQQLAQGVRQLGNLLRPDEADARPRDVRRGPLDELALHPGHVRLDHRSPAPIRRTSARPAAPVRSSSRSISVPSPTMPTIRISSWSIRTSIRSARRN